MRPMTTNEMADAAIRAYRALGGPCLRLTAVPALFATAAIYFLISYVLPLMTQTSDASNLNVQVGEAIVILGLAVGVALPLVIFSLAFSSALVTALVADFMVGNLPDPDSSRNLALKNIVRIFIFGVREAILGSGGLVLGALLLMVSALVGGSDTSNDFGGLISILGVLGITVGLIILPLVYGFESLAIPAMMVENVGVKAGAKRSRHLMKSNLRQPGGFGYVLNALATVFLLLLFLGAGFVAAFGLIASTEAGSAAVAPLNGNPLVDALWDIIPTFLTIWLLVPVWATMTTILYFERRVRLEGYDIETLGRDVGHVVKSNRFEL